MTFSSHKVTFESLADLVENRLAPPRRAEVEAHVSACASCAEQVARLTHLTGLMRSDESVDAPRDVLASAVGLFRARRSEGGVRALVGRLVATLTFDSLRGAPAFGVRSSGPSSDSRQLIFNAGPHDIDLRLARRASGWSISGQVFGECAGGSVRVEGGAGEAAAELNDLCEFRLPELPEGSYSLVFTLPGVEVEVQDIELRA